MVCTDSLVRITVGLRQGNSIDFQRVEEENALSPSSGGVRSSSWAFFRARRSLRVGRIRKKKRSDTRESISDPVTFFFQICPEPYAIQIDLMKSSDVALSIAHKIMSKLPKQRTRARFAQTNPGLSCFFLQSNSFADDHRTLQA